MQKVEFDVVVAGAGIAGISAAVKAGRMGASVALIERYEFLGGMSTAGMVSPFMKHAINNQPLVNGIFSALEMHMKKENGMLTNGFYASAFRSAAYSLLTGAQVTQFFNVELLSVNREKGKIYSLTILMNGQEIDMAGSVFIDTTGDAELVFKGDFDWEKGDSKSGNLQAMTHFFRMGGIDIPEAAAYTLQHKEDFFPWMDFAFDFSKIISIAGYFSFVKRAIAGNRLSPDIHYLFYTSLPESGEASFNTTNILGLDASSSYDLTKAEIIGRKQVHQVVDLLRSEIPGFGKSYLLETATQVGVRETRRAIGDYIVTGDDIRNGRKFEHSVARGCYGIDIHGQKEETDVMEDLAEGEYYEIPEEALIVRNAENLLVAGRCISATREGHGALRIMPTSSATGEACGALAALAASRNQPIRQIDYQLLKKEILHNVSFD